MGNLFSFCTVFVNDIPVIFGLSLLIFPHPHFENEYFQTRTILGSTGVAA